MQILIIDDDGQIRRVLRTTLEQQGHQVAEADNGQAGLEAFRRQPCDLVMCDLFMPEKDGLETIRELLTEFPDVKVIAMSGGGHPDFPDFLPMARRFGAVAILDKPFRPRQVLDAVTKALQRPESS
jgi:CheY-like chemotaxis protein